MTTPQRPQGPSTERPDWRRRIADADELLPTFEHSARAFHGTEHDALNAELYARVEQPMIGWGTCLSQLRGFSRRTFQRGETDLARVVVAMREFGAGYTSTEEAFAAADRIISREQLALPMGRLAEIQSTPSIDAEDLAAALSDLQNAEALLPGDVIDKHHALIAGLDEFTRCRVADCCIAMHERHHLDITEALRHELRVGNDFLTAFEARITGTRDRRRAAMSNDDIRCATECLQDEVTQGSDLVRTNMRRYGLFADAEADATVFDQDMRDLVAAAREMSSALKEQVAACGAGIDDDSTKVGQSIDSMTAEVRRRATEAADKFRDRVAHVEALNEDESKLWAEIDERLGRIETLSSSRSAVVLEALNDMQRASRAQRQGEAYIKGLAAHSARLRECQAVVSRLGRLSGSMDRYVGAMAPLLEEDTEDARHAVRELKIAETTALLHRYDQFAEAAELMRQYTENRLAGIGREARQRALDADVGASTYDPMTTEYEGLREVADVKQAAMRDFAARVKGLRDARKREVAPVIAFALDVLQDAPPGEKVLHGDVGLLAADVVPRIHHSPKRDVRRAAGLIEVRDMDVSRHPYLAAAVRALDEEDIDLGRAASYAAAEQTEAERRLTDIRKTEQLIRQTRMEMSPLRAITSK